MSNEQWREQCRAAGFPVELAAPLERFIDLVAVLRENYPPEHLYRLEFAERTLLREILTPDSETTHWWQTGLHIVRDGASAQAALDPGMARALDELEVQLAARLGNCADVSLREINADTVNGICLLSELMQYPQSSFVAPNAYSLAQALFSKTAWYRAVYAGKSPVGFVMLDDDPEKEVYYLWRFMIAPQFQHRGFGARALASVIEYVKTRPGARELLLSYIPHEQGPTEFYRSQGFSETGEVFGQEIEMRRLL